MKQTPIRIERKTMKADMLKVLETLTPAEKLDAIEFLVGALRRSSNLDASSQGQAMRQLLKEMEKLPVQNPNDGFSSRDHDKAIYGEAS
jgi:hypothetical protein